MAIKIYSYLSSPQFRIWSKLIKILNVLKKCKRWVFFFKFSFSLQSLSYQNWFYWIVKVVVIDLVIVTVKDEKL